MSSIAEKVIKPKLGVLELAKQLGNVSKACKVMGYSAIVFIVTKSCMKQEEKKRCRK